MRCEKLSSESTSNFVRYSPTLRPPRSVSWLKLTMIASPASTVANPAPPPRASNLPFPSHKCSPSHHEHLRLYSVSGLSRTGEQFIHDWDIVRHRAAGASSRFGAGISLDDLDCLGSKVSRQCPSIQSRRWSRLRREVAQVSAWPDADGEVA